MTISAVMKLSSAIRNRRASTISARAPAGSVNRNIGRLLATCTIDTALGSAFRLVISQPEAVSDIAMPVSEQVVAAQITANGLFPNAPQRVGADSAGSAAELGSKIMIAPLRLRPFAGSRYVHHDLAGDAATPRDPMPRNPAARNTPYLRAAALSAI